MDVSNSSSVTDDSRKRRERWRLTEFLTDQSDQVAISTTWPNKHYFLAAYDTPFIGPQFNLDEREWERVFFPRWLCQ